MFESEFNRSQRELSAISFLEGKGWRHIDSMIFTKAGKKYDLSAADLTQVDRIERENLFVITH